MGSAMKPGDLVSPMTDTAIVWTKSGPTTWDAHFNRIRIGGYAVREPRRCDAFHAHRERPLTGQCAAMATKRAPSHERAPGDGDWIFGCDLHADANPWENWEPIATIARVYFGNTARVEAMAIDDAAPLTEADARAWVEARFREWVRLAIMWAGAWDVAALLAAAPRDLTADPPDSDGGPW